MDGKTDTRKRIVAIVPAFNEAGMIHNVLRTLTSYPGFHEVIVVDDGSSDGTAAVAASFPVRLIRHERNRGKGRAMAIGVHASDADVLFFCDADMYGLTNEMLDSILLPVVRGESEMVIAMRNWRMYYAGFILTIMPILGGQRALTRALWEQVPHAYKERFMIETALNFYARYWGNGFQYKVCPGLKQVTKERKYGLWKGFLARVRMSAEVIVTQIRLQFWNVPPSLRAGRAALRNMAGAVFGTLLGALILIASYRGPAAFVREVFANELRENPDAPLVHLLLYAASNVGADIIAFIGAALIALNVLVFFLNSRNLRYLAYRPARAERVG